MIITSIDRNQWKQCAWQSLPPITLMYQTPLDQRNKTRNEIVSHFSDDDDELDDDIFESVAVTRGNLKNEPQTSDLSNVKMHKLQEDDG